VVRMRMIDPIDRAVGNRLKSRRMALNMSQSALADELGLTFQQIQKYETGLSRISAGRLHRIAEIMKVDLAFFFPEDGPAIVATNHPDQIALMLETDDGAALASAFRRISSAKVRRRLVALIQELAALRNQTFESSQQIEINLSASAHR
jgi:transcriptional regulator with XRE-family HTH domain